MHCKSRLILQPHAHACLRMHGFAYFADDLAFLEMSDIELLNLPTLAEGVMTRCIKLGMCKPPLVFDFAAELENSRKPIQVQNLSFYFKVRFKHFTMHSNASL